MTVRALLPRAIAAFGLMVSTTPTPVAAQVLISPSSHFGAAMYAEPRPSSQLGFHFDRFTRFGKETTATGAYDFKPYNGIPETVGLNFLAYSVTKQLGDPAKSILSRVVTQIGYGHNQPTKWAQNKMHDTRHPPLLHVPDSLIRTAFDVGVSGDITRWYTGVHDHLPIFVGGGASVSTVYQEGFAHFGVRRAPLRVRGYELIRLSAMLRGGLTLGGDAFPSQYLQRAYGAAQYSVSLPLYEYYGRPWLFDLLEVTFLPDLEFILSHDTGFFRGLNGTGLHEFFVSVRAGWFHDLVVAEMWNDTVNNKDKGPTGGFRLYVRTSAFPVLSLLP